MPAAPMKATPRIRVVQCGDQGPQFGVAPDHWQVLS